ncbi:MAG: SusD/RagB family nutrient-binding outer membrane lipoprotein, partial [Bacteroidales bacterium]|nr:SusD/RagB family nutrient-binding outer membrane lipoprotein [Bacteroidales bacterium]
MIMRKIFSILLSGLFVLGVWSCSEDIMDDINANVNDPTEVGSHLIITDAMVTSAFSVTGSDLAFYAGVYIEHNVGVWNQSYA